MMTNPSPTPPRTTFHHGHLANALVAAASAYIAAERSVAFSLRQIADAVGVSHTAAYRHFRSKQDLIVELAIRGFRSLQEALRRATPEAGDHLAALAASARAYVAHGLANPGHYRMMFHGDLCQEYHRTELSEAAKAAFNMLLHLVQQGQASGAIRQDRDAMPLAAGLWAALHGHTMLLLDGQISEGGTAPAPRIEASLDDLLVVLLAGCAPPQQAAPQQ